MCLNAHCRVKFLLMTAGDHVHSVVSAWLDRLPEGKTANWILGNHDYWRVGSRFGAANIDGFNMISLLLPGVAVTYNGEEIGMINTEVSWKETVDPAGINCGQEHYNVSQHIISGGMFSNA